MAASFRIFSRNVIFLVAIFFVGANAARAQEALTAVHTEGTAEADTAVVASREIQAHAIADTARAKVTEIIGEKRFQKNERVIEARIVRQAAKFIPFVNSGTPVQQPDGTWKMGVDMKLSMASLRKMVQDNGLMNDAEGPAVVLPLVAFRDDKAGVGLRWWAGETKDDAHKLIEQVNQLFYAKMQPEFLRQGFHLVKPLDLPVSPLPESARSEELAPAQLNVISNYYNVPMVMVGEVKVQPAHDKAQAATVARLQVVQISSGRVVAEVTRQMDSDAAGAFENAIRAKVTPEFPDLAKELAGQLNEAWQRGTLNTNLVRLSLRGQLSPKQLGDFKSGLTQSLHEVKSVKERFFQPGEITLEIDYSGDAAPLAEHLKALHMADFDTKVAEVKDKEIDVDVRALR